MTERTDDKQRQSIGPSAPELARLEALIAECRKPHCGNGPRNSLTSALHQCAPALVAAARELARVDGYDRYCDGEIKRLERELAEMKADRDQMVEHYNEAAVAANQAARCVGATPHVAALKVVRAMIRGEMIEHAIVDLAEPNVGLGEWLDRRIGER